MKIIITDYEDYSEVTIRGDGGINLHTFTFDDRKQATAFNSGFQCAKTVANSLIQSIPMTYERIKG